MKKKILSMLLIATMIVTMCMQTSVAFASQGETEEPFNSTITAISSDKDSFIIETGAGCLNGNVRGGSSISTANMNVNGSVTENANIKTPILFDAIDEKYFSDFESISSAEELEKIGNNINGAVKISNKLELNRGLNLNGALQTEGDLIIGGPAFNANNAVIVSETGNVTLKSDNISFSGLIYLPYGTLTIEGDNVNLNNVCIIADKINIKAKYNLNINSNRELIKFVDKNAVYEDNKLYIFAEGKIDGTKLTIKWYTNIDIDEFDIYESETDTEDYSGYKLLANVEKDNQYTCELNNDLTEMYYYVEADKYKSIGFKVINKNGNYTIEYKDSDGDGIPDGIEEIYGTNVFNKDSDGDGLSDYDEVMIVGTHPLKKDTNGNGINDYDDDVDKDGLSNGYEVSIGTNPAYKDTDMDGLTDYDEVNIYGTNPTKKDTDGDKADDNWEINNNTDPLVKNSGFSISATTGGVNEYNPVGASVYIDSAKADPESLTIDRVMPSDNYYISPMVAGYLGDGFDFNLDGSFDEATLVFSYDESLGKVSDGFQPRIYYYDEENKMFEELANQTVEDGKVTAVTTHFSTYVLLNKVEFDKVWESNIKAAAGENTLNVALVVDLSGSMRNYKIDTAKTVINTFVDELEEKDSSALISFTSFAELRCGFTEDKDVIKNAVNRMTVGGLTAIYTGIERALDEFEANDINGYKMMVVFTDGYDEPSTTYEANYRELVERAKKDGVTIYTIGIGTIDENILTNVANNTCGSYFHANVISDLKGVVDNVRDEAKDLVTDSNNDGICDYYTEEIKEGRLVLSNGSLELKGFDLNLNADGEPSDDWDGDGLKNGEELTIVTKFGKTYIEMKSNPFMQYTDFDEVNDYDEVKHGSDPMNYSLEKAPADSLMNSSAYAYESYANDMRYGTFNSYMIGYSSVISGVWNKQELYRNLIVDYYSNYMTTNVVNSDKKLEWKKTIYDAFKQLYPSIGTNYALANDMNIMASYINGCNSPDRINDYFNSKVASFLKELNKLSEDATQLRFEVNQNGKYVTKYITEKQALILAERLGNLSEAMVFATSAADLCDNINGLIEIKANEEYFAGNMELLIKLQDSKISDLSMAAVEIRKILAEEYIGAIESIAVDLFKEGIEIADNVIWNFAAFKIPYVNIIAAVRDVSLVVTGAKEDVQQMYRMLCYSEMSLVYTDLFYSKILDSNNRYYNMSEMTDNYLTNIAQLRILGEEEQYDFYKNDGIFSGLVNLFNNSEEVRENTNNSIKYIKRQANTLHLILSNNMKFEV